MGDKTFHYGDKTFYYISGWAIWLLPLCGILLFLLATGMLLAIFYAETFWWSCLFFLGFALATKASWFFWSTFRFNRRVHYFLRGHEHRVRVLVRVMEKHRGEPFNYVAHELRVNLLTRDLEESSAELFTHVLEKEYDQAFIRALKEHHGEAILRVDEKQRIHVILCSLERLARNQQSALAMLAVIDRRIHEDESIETFLHDL